jgi:hypothetical protein
MSLIRPAQMACCLGLVLAFALPTASGQEGSGQFPAAKAEPAQKVARLVYPVRRGSAKELANTLSLFFKAEPAFQAMPDAGSNALLLSGPAPVVEEANAVLRQIDRPVRTVHVEVILLELTGKPDGDATDLKRPDLAGSARDLEAKIRDLQKQGVIGGVKRVQLTALEMQMARSQVGASKPSVAGVGFSSGGFPGGGGRGGGVSRSISYRDVGTLVQVKPEVGADGLVTLELRVEKSRVHTPEGGVPIGTDEKGAPIPAAEFLTSTLETRLKVGRGRAVLAQSATTGSKAGQSETLILVTASTDETGPRDGK